MSTEQEQAKHWGSVIPGGSEPDEPASPEPAEEDRDINIDPPTLEEVQNSKLHQINKEL